MGPYKSALAELWKLDCEEAEGAKFRARVKWMEEGECSSAFFCRLEQKKASDRLIPALRGSDGLLYSGREGLASVLMDFYVGLFSRGDADSSAQQILLSKVPKQLSSACAHECEGFLTVTECFSALQGMARVKPQVWTASPWNSIFASGTCKIRTWLRF